MQRWFLSYHSPDQALAERLKLAIERRDVTSRVFFAPTQLRAGGSWSKQLAQEIAEATAFILIIGAAGVGPWQVLEYNEAIDKWASSARKFPIIVVLLEGQVAPGLPFLRQLHWIVTPDPTSERDIGRILDAASGSDSSSTRELWRYTCPYRGLEAMAEKDSDYFFGRNHEIVEVLHTLASAPDRMPVLIGNSGVGASSLAQAGVLATLKRQAWPKENSQAPNDWPAAFQNSRQWCFLSFKPGTHPLRAVVQAFLDTWQFAATDPEKVTRQHGWTELFQGGKATLPDLLDATENRYRELALSAPPAFCVYIDQGHELYVRADERERRAFSGTLAQALSDQRLRAIMSMRGDFFGELHKDEALHKVSRRIDVRPLRDAQLLEVAKEPALLLGAHFATEQLASDIVRQLTDEASKDAGALPLLSYLLDDMWNEMVQRADGVLRLPAQVIDLGGLLVERANRFLAQHPASGDALRRVLTLKLVSVREDGQPSRRRAARTEFSNEEWRLISELADYPTRLLVTVTTEAGETYAEVAHEAIFRRWHKLRDWTAAEREFLTWRSELERYRSRWEMVPTASKNKALLHGLDLEQAQAWLAIRDNDISPKDPEFIASSTAQTQTGFGSLWRRGFTSATPKRETKPEPERPYRPKRVIQSALSKESPARREVFISYRRDDDPGMALALHAHLANALSEKKIFMDVEDGIPPGQDFVKVLEERVSECDVMLAVIGKGWLTAVDSQGRRRLDNPDDFIRIEIESAMQQGKIVIPVLINNTEMPRASELPDSMRLFARRQAMWITSRRLRADAEGLIEKIQEALRGIPSRR